MPTDSSAEISSSGVSGLNNEITAAVNEEEYEEREEYNPQFAEDIPYVTKNDFAEVIYGIHEDNKVFIENQEQLDNGIYSLEQKLAKQDKQLVEQNEQIHQLKQLLSEKEAKQQEQYTVQVNDLKKQLAEQMQRQLAEMFNEKMQQIQSQLTVQATQNDRNEQSVQTEPQLSGEAGESVNSSNDSNDLELSALENRSNNPQAVTAGNEQDDAQTVTAGNKSAINFLDSKNYSSKSQAANQLNASALQNEQQAQSEQQSKHQGNTPASRTEPPLQFNASALQNELQAQSDRKTSDMSVSSAQDSRNLKLSSSDINPDNSQSAVSKANPDTTQTITLKHKRRLNFLSSENYGSKSKATKQVNFSALQNEQQAQSDRKTSDKSVTSAQNSRNLELASSEANPNHSRTFTSVSRSEINFLDSNNYDRLAAVNKQIDELSSKVNDPYLQSKYSEYKDQLNNLYKERAALSKINRSKGAQQKKDFVVPLKSHSQNVIVNPNSRFIEDEPQNKQDAISFNMNREKNTSSKINPSSIIPKGALHK